MSRPNRRPFGSLRRLPSGRIQARYRCPVCEQAHPAHTTFDTEGDADTWLAGVRSDIARERFTCPTARKATETAQRAASRPFGVYAEQWLEDRARTLKPRTVMLYRRQLAELLPVFRDLPLTSITRDTVTDWWRELGRAHPTRHTGNAHVYGLLRTIMGAAVKEGRIASNPCQVERAGGTKRRRPMAVPTADELPVIATAMPARLQLAIYLAAFCALRFGEWAELRRRDVDLGDEVPVLNVERAVVQREGRTIVGAPKSGAGVRSVHVPPALRPMLVTHLDQHAQPGPDGLLFTSSAGARGRCDCGHLGCVGGHLRSSAFYSAFIPARAAAGRSDVRVHDLRHFGAVEAAREGATLAELMARLGHSTVAAAMRYQHATRERDADLARRMQVRIAAPGGDAD